MATIGDLERTIVFLASNYASAICQLDGTETRAKETSDRLIAAREEVEALLTENASLRSDINELESAIHRLCDDRMTVRFFGRVFRKEFIAHGATIDELRSKLEVEEVRANTYRQERDGARQTIGLVRLECERLHAATEDDLRTIENLRMRLNKTIAKLHTARGFGGKGVASKKGKRK